MSESNATSSRSSNSNTSLNVSRNAASTHIPISFPLNTMPSDEPDESLPSSNGTSARILTRSLAKLQQQQIDNKIQKQPAVTYQKILTKEKSCNIINILEKSRFSGHMPRLIADVIYFIFKKFFFNNFHVYV